MKAPFRVFLIIFSFGLSQAWAFEGFHTLWGKSDKSENSETPEVKKLKSERAAQVSELKEVEPRYFMIHDEVKSLLPNLIGAIEGKGAGEKLTSQDISQLCAELKKDLRRPEACLGYVKRRALVAKEDLINFMETREAKLREIYPRYRAIKNQIATLTEEIEKTENSQ